MELPRNKRVGDHVRSTGSRWGWRTIRDSRVRWKGDLYELMIPTEPDLNGRIPPDYDGRLEGQRLLFYDYGDWPGLENFVFAFGDERWPGPTCGDDGVFWWERFQKVEG